MAELRMIRNLAGVLYYLDTPLLRFKIENKKLVEAQDLSEHKLWPPEIALYGLNYVNINDFFKRRTMKEGCMFYREHLNAIGMTVFDFDRYIRQNNGNNNLDNYWVKFDDFGAKCFADIVNM